MSTIFTWWLTPWLLDSNGYLSPMRNSTASDRRASRENRRAASTSTRSTSPPRVGLPSFGSGETTNTPPGSSRSSDYLSAGSKTLPPLPLTPTTPDSSSFFDTSELFDAFPSVPQNVPTGPGTSLLSGIDLGTSSDMGKAATISSSYRSTFQSYR